MNIYKICSLVGVVACWALSTGFPAIAFEETAATDPYPGTSAESLNKPNTAKSKAQRFVDNSPEQADQTASDSEPTAPAKPISKDDKSVTESDTNDSTAEGETKSKNVFKRKRKAVSNPDVEAALGKSGDTKDNAKSAGIKDAKSRANAKMSFDDSKTPVAELDPLPHYEKAVSLMQQHLWGQAVAELRISLQLNPHYYDAVDKLALIYQLTGHDAEAIWKYKKLLDVRPDYMDAHINLGTLLSKKGDMKEAEAEFHKAIDMNYYSFQAHFDLANALAGHDRCKEALAEYKLSLRMVAPMSTQAALVHNNIGAVYQQKNYLKEASSEFKRAWTIQPDNKMFQHNIDLVQKMMKDGPVQEKMM